MRVIMFVGLAIGLTATSLPAFAVSTTATANRSESAARDQPQANGASADQRRICIRDVRSESHIRREICHTAREWRDQGGVPTDQ